MAPDGKQVKVRTRVAMSDCEVAESSMVMRDAFLFAPRQRILQGPVFAEAAVPGGQFACGHRRERKALDLRICFPFTSGLPLRMTSRDKKGVWWRGRRGWENGKVRAIVEERGSDFTGGTSDD